MGGRNNLPGVPQEIDDYVEVATGHRPFRGAGEATALETGISRTFVGRLTAFRNPSC